MNKERNACSSIRPASVGGSRLRHLARWRSRASHGRDFLGDGGSRRYPSSIRSTWIRLARFRSSCCRWFRRYFDLDAGVGSTPLLAHVGCCPPYPADDGSLQSNDRFSDASRGLYDHAGEFIVARATSPGFGDLVPPAAVETERQRSILAKFIATIEPERSEHIASRLLGEFHSLNRIWSQSPETLARFFASDSIIPTLLLGAHDLIVEGMRVEIRGTKIDPGDRKLLQYLMASMGSLPDETLRVLFLNSAGRLIVDEQLQVGTLGQLAVYPRPLFRRAIEHNAAGLVLVHNHPSGDPTPSVDDIAVTRTLARIAGSLDIEIVEHIVVTGTQSRRIIQPSSKPRLGRPLNDHRLKDGAPDCFDREEMSDMRALDNAKRTIRRRILRRQLLGPAELFGEPAWDVLIDLFIHECEDKPISVSSLWGATGLSESSSKRVLQKLYAAELIYRMDDPTDGRRQFVRLSPNVANRLRAYFSQGTEE